MYKNLWILFIIGILFIIFLSIIPFAHAAYRIDIYDYTGNFVREKVNYSVFSANNISAFQWICLNGECIQDWDEVNQSGGTTATADEVLKDTGTSFLGEYLDSIIDQLYNWVVSIGNYTQDRDNIAFTNESNIFEEDQKFNKSVNITEDLTVGTNVSVGENIEVGNDVTVGQDISVGRLVQSLLTNTTNNTANKYKFQNSDSYITADGSGNIEVH